MNAFDRYRQNYTPTPPSSRAGQWLEVAAGIIAFAAIGALLAWRG
jgi:hypothetical protein